MAYETAGSIISDAAAELGLGTVTDAYGSTDANIIQLRGLLKSGGRDLVRDRDWTHLIKEYAIVTRPNWVASTLYTQGAQPWTKNTIFSVNAMVQSGGNLYRCTTGGRSIDGPSPAGPQGLSASILDGDNGLIWKFENTGYASIVVHGAFYYVFASVGTCGLIAPQGAAAGTETDDNGVNWAFGGNASDYPLPSDFSNLIDQTGWNRTNSLPVGGPVDGQMWQYLKGRQQGVVFNVLFRPVAGIMRLYPDTDTPGGHQITFEYVSNWWVSAAGGTAPTTDAPTANGDIIYFDPLLVLRRLKLDWLKVKGFDTTHAQREYDDELEEVKNSDGASPVLNLQGRGPYDPLVGAQNVPWTGFGS